MQVSDNTTELRNYSFNEHKHRFAVWTAARAVQRSFTTTECISEAINASLLKSFVEIDFLIDQEQFDSYHRIWCSQITGWFDKGPLECSYGRAAKMIAIYLKTSYILPTRGEGHNCSVIHPPLDSILLKAIAKNDLAHLKKETWTTFEDNQYWQVVASIRNVHPFDWTLEKYWKPEKEKSTEKEIRGMVY